MSIVRKTVNLSAEEATELQGFFTEGARERMELAQAVGEEAPLYSDSAALRALALLGARAIRDRITGRGYATLAESYGEEDRAAGADALTMADEAWRG